MSISVFNPEKVIEFMPEYSGNRESSTPCVVGLKYISYARVKKYANLYSKRSADTTDPSKLTLVTQEIQKKQFLDNVVSVTGVFDGPREITDVTEFYDLAPQPLIFEIMSAMENPGKIKAGLLKKQTSTKTGAKRKPKKEG